MANFTLQLTSEVGKGASATWYYAPNSVGHSYGNPVDVEIGDTVTFTRGAGSVGNGIITLLNIFTDNSNITLSGSNTTVVRTIATGSTTLDSIQGANGGSATDTFFLERQAAAADTTPNAFVFTDLSNQPRSSFVGTNTITISGLSTGTSVSVVPSGTGTSNSYSKNGGSFTTANGTAVNGDTFRPAHTTSASYSTQLYTRLTIGGVQGTFFSTTQAAPSDTTPDAFSFTALTNQPLSSFIGTNTITVAGLSSGVSTAVSVSGGSYSKNGGSFTTANTTAVNGNTFRPAHTSSASYSTATNTTLNIGGVTATYTSTTQAADTTPNAFTFTDVTGAALSSTQTSNQITVAGLSSGVNTYVQITSGTSYSKNGAAYTPNTGVAQNGDTFRVRHTASGSYNTAASCTLTIGTITDTFTSTTLPEDTTPAAFTFTDVSGKPQSQVQTSNLITVSGLTAGTAVNFTITGGSYSGNGGTYSTANGNTVNGDTFTVRHTSSASFSTAVSTTLNINGVLDTFTSTTTSADTVPNAIVFNDKSAQARGAFVSSSNAPTISGLSSGVSTSISITGLSSGSNSSYSKNGGAFTAANGTVQNGDTVRLGHTTSGSFSTQLFTQVNIGGTTSAFFTTTLGSDSTPDAFSFTDVPGTIARSSVQTSNQITVAGMNTSTAVSVSGGSYSKNGAGYTTANTTAVNGDKFTVRHTSSASFSTATNTTLTIGGVSDIFTSNTIGADTTPAAFTFTDVTGVARYLAQVSNNITVSGLNTSTGVSVSGGTYSKNNSATFSGGNTTAVNGDTFKLLHTSSASFSTATNTTLTIGGVSDTFTSTTLGSDTTPNAFSFTDVPGTIARSSVQTSNQITVAGMNTSTVVSISGGSYSKNGGSYTTANTTASNTDTFTVRHTATTAFSTATNTTLNIGGVTDTFSSTTVAQDTTPNAFTFTDTTAALNAVKVSNQITVAGLSSSTSTSVSISTSGSQSGEYSKNGAGYVSSPTTAVNGDTFTVRHTASASFSTATNTTLTIGGVSDIFTSTTIGADTTPIQFNFTDVTNVHTNTAARTALVQITGINTTATVVHSNQGTFAVSGSTTVPSAANFSTANKTITNNQYVHVKSSPGAYPGNTVNNTITIGSISDTWTITNLAADQSPDQFYFTDVTSSELSAVANSSIQIAGINYLVASAVPTGVTSVVNNSSTPSGTFNGNNKNMTNGQYLHVRRTASGSYGTTLAATITIGDKSDVWNITTRASVNQPNTFNFTDITDKVKSSYHLTYVQITGIETSATATRTSGAGTFAISSSTSQPSIGSFGTGSLSVTNNQYLHIRMQASASFNTAITSTFDVGGTSDDWSITTEASDTTPENLGSFSNLTNQAQGSAIIQSLQVNDINDTTSVTQNTFAGGTAFSFAVSSSASTSGLTYNSTAKTVTNGQYVHFRVFTNALYNSLHSSNISVGGVQRNWQVRTAAADTSVNDYTLTDITSAIRNQLAFAQAVISGIEGAASPTTVTISGNDGKFAVTNSSSTPGSGYGTTGTIYNGQYLHVRQTASSIFNTGKSTTVVVGNGTYSNETFTVTTLPDNEPTAFAIPAATGQNINTIADARSAQVNGMATGTTVPVTVSGTALFAIGSSTTPGAYSQASKTISNGGYIWVKQGTGSNFSTTITSTITAGGTGGEVSETFSTTTVAADTTPASFSFSNLTGQNTSATITQSRQITGINTSTSVTQTIFSGTFTFAVSSSSSTAGLTFNTLGKTITNNQYVHFRVLTSSSQGLNSSANVTVGGFNANWQVATLSSDSTPDSFTIPDKTGAPSSVQNAAVQITGLNTSATVSRTSGAATFAVSSSATTPSAASFNSTDKTITNNQYLHCKQTASTVYNATLNTVIDIGGVTDTWTVTTTAAPSDGTPDPYTLTDVTVALSTVANAYAQIQGISVTAVASRTSGTATFAVSSSTTTPSSGFSAANKNVTNNQYLHVRDTSSASNSTTLPTIFSVGGVSSTWNVTTVAATAGSGNYGLRVFAPTQTTIPRLDTTDRTIRVLGVHTGSIAATGSTNTTVTVTQAGFSSTDSTIGVEWQTSGDPQYVSLTSSGTSITITRSASDPSPSSNTFQIRIFKI